jgi:hypothetical protein
MNEPSWLLPKTARTKEDYQYHWWITEHFRNETELQNAIQLILRAEGIWHIRECKAFGPGRSRSDFGLLTSQHGDFYLYLEAKIETKSTSFDRAIGQALRNTVQNQHKTWIVLPDDVKIGTDQLQTLRSIGSDVVRISRLPDRLKASPLSNEFKTFGHLNKDAACEAWVHSSDELLTARRCPREHHQRYYGIGIKRGERMRASMERHKMEMAEERKKWRR